ncbi:MAG: hypothetical protein JWQ09_3560 [Segetibacter sp.]|nr:hypothetical protein [Segetibacter sp.]
MKKILYFLSATDPEMACRCSPRARIQRKTIGAFVLFGMVVAAMSGFMFAYSIRHVWWHGILGAIITSVFIGLQDRAIFLAKGKLIVAARLVLLLGSSYILSLPMKMYFVQDSIKASLDETYKQENAHRYEGVANADADFAARRTKAEGDIENLERDKLKFTRLRAAEETGYALASVSSGLNGRGPQWRSYNDQVNALETAIQRKRDAITSLAAEHAKDRSLAEDQFEMMKVEPEYSFTNQLAGFDRLLNDGDEYKSAAAKKVNLILTILFILFESAPALLKAFLPETDYERMVDNHDDLDTNFQTSVSGYLHQEITNVGDSESTADFTSMKLARTNKTNAYDDIKQSVNHYFA